MAATNYFGQSEFGEYYPIYSSAGITISSSMSGSSTMTGSISDSETLASALAGSSSLNVSITNAESLTATLFGSSTMTASLTDADSIVASLSGSSTMSGVITNSEALSSAISGSSSLTAAITKNTPLAASLSGSSSMSASFGAASYAITADLLGSSSMSTDLTDADFLVANLSGSSSMVASVSFELVLSASFSGSSSMSAHPYIGVPSIPAILGVRLNKAQIYSNLDPSWWLRNYYNQDLYWQPVRINFTDNMGNNKYKVFNTYGTPQTYVGTVDIDMYYNYITTTLMKQISALLEDWACSGNIANPLANVY